MLAQAYIVYNVLLLPLDFQERVSARISELAENFGSTRGAGGTSLVSVSRLEGMGEKVGNKTESAISRAVLKGTELAIESCECCVARIAKQLIFATNMRREQREARESISNNVALQT